MSGSLSSRTLAVTLENGVIRRISVAADFFHAYPRLGGGSTSFSTSDEYRAAIYRLGIPYLVTGAVLLLAALVANFYFFARRGVVPGADDTHESNPNDRNCVGKSFLLFSCFLNLAVILCISIAFSSAFTMRAAAYNARDVLHAARGNVSEHVGASAQLLHTFSERAAALKLDDISDELSASVKGVQQMFARRSVNFANLVRSTEGIYDRLRAIDDEVENLSTRFFWFTVLVLLLCVVGLLLSFVCDATTPDSKQARITAFALLLIPMAATWAFTAISTWVAVASGDFCQSVSEYSEVVRLQADGSTVTMPDSNIFAQFKLQCPSLTAATRDLKELNLFLGNSVVYPGFSEGLNAISSIEVSADSWGNASNWMQERWELYKQCDTQVTLAGKLSYHICGDHGLSAVAAIGQLWLCSFGLTLLFLAVVALLTWGHPPSEFCSGRELMYMYGAPRLISAFGDVRSVLSRHSTFRKLESGMFTLADISSDSSDVDVMKKVAREYNLDDNSTMSTHRPRRNAYTSHRLKDKKAKRSDWFADSDDRSTDSSGFS